MTDRPIPGPRSIISVEDRLAAMDIVTRYTHLYDAGVTSGLGELFTEDAVMETAPQPAIPVPGYPFPARGRVAIVEALSGFQGAFADVRRHHLADAPTLTLLDDDRLRSVASFAVIHSAAGASTEIVGAGWYEDEIVRETDGQWRIRHRVVHRDRRGAQVDRYY
jgi:hypothetical protein